MVGIAGAAAEHQRRHVEVAGVGVGQARDQFALTGAVRGHPSLHRGDELLGVKADEPFPVRRVRRDLWPTREGGDGFHPTVPYRGDRRAVIVRERQEAEDAAADPPHGDPPATAR